MSDLSIRRLWSWVERAWAAFRDSPVGRHLRSRYPRVWAFVAARFAPGTYLGLHLTIGLLVCLLGLWIFGSVAEDVVRREPLTVLDARILGDLRAHATPGRDRLFVAISLVGSPLMMAAIAAAGAVGLALRRAWVLFSGWVTAFAGGVVLVSALKAVFRRPRPSDAAAFLHGQSFSFPSGHALGSLVGFGMLAYLVVVSESTRRARAATIALGTALVLAIGLSRLYLGVHYLSDVIAGFAVGGLWLSACVSGMEVVRRRALAMEGRHDGKTGIPTDSDDG